MNRKISLGMAVTIVILAMTVTFSITFPPTSALSCIWLHWHPE